MGEREKKTISSPHQGGGWRAKNLLSGNHTGLKRPNDDVSPRGLTMGAPAKNVQSGCSLDERGGGAEQKKNPFDAHSPGNHACGEKYGEASV